MLRIKDIKVKVEEKYKLNKKIAHKLGIKVENIKSIKILKESIDARYKPDIYYVYEVAVDLNIKLNKNIEEYIEE